MVYGWCTDVDGWGTDGALKMCVDGAQMVSSCARMRLRWCTDGAQMEHGWGRVATEGENGA